MLGKNRLCKVSEVSGAAESGVNDILKYVGGTGEPR